MDYRITAKENGTTLITLVGSINEDAELSLQTLKSELKDIKTLTFNFKQSTTINSLGVRAWVQFLRSIEDGRAISFEDCTSDIIMQINMIPNFAGKSKIESFFTNYICEACNAQQKVLIYTKDLPAKSMPEKQKCAACGEQMETEELEEEYFVFLVR